MQSIFIEKPYQFVRPLMSRWLPKLMNNRLIHWPLLRFTESIVAVESFGFERLRESVDAGHAVMMIGNHPRVADPVTIYDLIRKANTPIYAMASWHLFNQGWFQQAVLRLYGAYSVNREGLDRESINFSVDALNRNVRPVLMFPEGATTATSESLMPFLDGPIFIARTVARRRHKRGLKTLIHPVVFRYQSVEDFQQELNRLLIPVESELGINHEPVDSPTDRILRALDAMVQRKENDFEVPQPAENLSPFERRQRLAIEVMSQAEQRCFGVASSKDITNRIRDVRSKVFPEILNDDSLNATELKVRWRDLERTSLAWQMASYPCDYLSGEPSNDRLLEYAVKIQADLTNESRKWGKQKVIVECLDAIEVPAAKHRSNEPDPLADEIRNSLNGA